MGYTTTYDGTFQLDRALQPEHATYLHRFSQTRRMQRDAQRAATLPDPIREAAGLPLGEEGAYFTGGDVWSSDGDVSVLDHNEPPQGCPGLWCQWVPTEDGKGIEWNGAEKFYHAAEWLEFITLHFLIPWKYVLTGRVTWQGESENDLGTLVVLDGDKIVECCPPYHDRSEAEIRQAWQERGL